MDYTIASGVTAIDSGDTPPVSGTPGEFTEGNPATSTPATRLPAYQMNALVREIRNAIVAAGLTPDRTNTGQLAAAIQKFVQSSYAADTGTVNALVVTLAPAPTALTDGLKVRIKAANTVTGPATLNLNGLGAKAITISGGTALAGGEIVAGGFYEFTYSTAATAFLITAQSAGQVVVPTAVLPGAAVNLGQFGSTLAASGYQKLPSGLIIQWGQYLAASADTAYTVSLPITFPNNHFQAFATNRQSGSTVGSNSAYAIPGTTANVVLTADYSTGGPSTNLLLSYLCIGN